jgi:hypothetical protein
MEDVRECRLRPEFAHLYEELTPDVWVPAREWAERLVVRAKGASVEHSSAYAGSQPLRVSRRRAASPPARGPEPPGRSVEHTGRPVIGAPALEMLGMAGWSSRAGGVLPHNCRVCPKSYNSAVAHD